MSNPTLAELIPLLQTAIWPVILISGAGLLLLSMTNRLGRVVDRARALCEQYAEKSPVRQASLRRQLVILERRGVLLRRSIISISVSILAAAVLVGVLFLSAFFRLEVGWLLILLFSGCLATLIASLTAFMQDVNLSLAALKLEKEVMVGNEKDEG